MLMYEKYLRSDQTLYIVIANNACLFPTVNSNPRVKREVINAVDFHNYPYEDSKSWYILHSCLLPQVPYGNTGSWIWVLERPESPTPALSKLFLAVSLSIAMFTL